MPDTAKILQIQRSLLAVIKQARSDGASSMEIAFALGITVPQLMKLSPDIRTFSWSGEAGGRAVIGYSAS